MLTYPVHQAADILAFRGNLVPVGRDQLPHLELTRTIARRFNERYGPLFPEPEALLSAAPRLLGLDGTRKMGKSAGNAIALRASADETARADPQGAGPDAERRIAYDPARRPEVANLVLLAALCRGAAPEAIAAEVGDGGASALKALVTEAVNDRLAPLRARRAELVRDPAYLKGVLEDGNERARARAAETLAAVRRLMYTDLPLTPSVAVARVVPAAPPGGHAADVSRAPPTRRPCAGCGPRSSAPISRLAAVAGRRARRGRRA